MNLLQRYDNLVAKQATTTGENIGTPDPEVIDLYTISELGLDTDIDDTEIDDSDLKVYIPKEEISIMKKEESMDALHSCECNPLCNHSYTGTVCSCPCPDDGGYTTNNVQTFLEKYQDGNDIIQVLRKNIMAIASDIQYIKESNNNHEQWALDYADALNELSVSF